MDLDRHHPLLENRLVTGIDGATQRDWINRGFTLEELLYTTGCIERTPANPAGTHLVDNGLNAIILVKEVAQNCKQGRPLSTSLGSRMR